MGSPLNCQQFDIFDLTTQLLTKAQLVAMSLRVPKLKEQGAFLFLGKTNQSICQSARGLLSFCTLLTNYLKIANHCPPIL